MVENTRINCCLILCIVSLLACELLLRRKKKPHWLRLNWDFTLDCIIPIFSH